MLIQKLQNLAGLSKICIVVEFLWGGSDTNWLPYLVSVLKMLSFRPGNYWRSGEVLHDAPLSAHPSLHQATM